MKIITYPPESPELIRWSDDPLLITPQQTHSTNIIEVRTGQEDLRNCDGLWTKNPNLRLGVKTADCAPIAFWDEEKFGIIHVGWRGLCNGIVEKMCKTVFPDLLHESGLGQVRTQVWVGPMLPQFEIQPDDCYDQIQAKFRDQFFVEQSGKTYFDFRGALEHLLPTAQFDGRSTYDTLALASWRRDQDERRNVTLIKSQT